MAILWNEGVGALHLGNSRHQKGVDVTSNVGVPPKRAVFELNDGSLGG